MSYLISIMIGAIVGFVLGQTLKGSRHGSALDALLGAFGACGAVLLLDRVAPTFAGGWLMGAIVAVVGGAVPLFVMCQFIIRKPAPAMRGRFSR